MFWAHDYGTTYVCFDCKLHRRRIGRSYKLVPCSKCHQPMIWIGQKLRVPKKRDIKQWDWLYKIAIRENRKRTAGKSSTLK